jgi:hypothetical protein
LMLYNVYTLYTVSGKNRVHVAFYRNFDNIW